MNRPQETAIVLSGGGAYGAFSVGVMKALFAGRSPATGYQPFDAGIFTGTSVGAFNAAVMAGYPNENSLDTAFRLEKIWLDQIASRTEDGSSIFRLRNDPLEYAHPESLRHPLQLAGRFMDDTLATSRYLVSRTANFLASSFAASPSSLPDRVLAAVNIGSFVDSQPFYELLHRVIDEQAILKSSKALEIIATDWVNGKIRTFNKRDFHDGQGILGIAASAAIPGIFPPVPVDEGLCVDGGVVCNTPVSSAISHLGAVDLHAIYLLPHPRIMPIPNPPSTMDTMLRAYFLMLATIVDEDIETARWINAGKRAAPQHMSAADAEEFQETVGRILGKTRIREAKIVSIHRYLPDQPLGGNLGMLDFSRKHIAERIEEGEKAAMQHDCTKSRCVLANE